MQALDQSFTCSPTTSPPSQDQDPFKQNFFSFWEDCFLKVSCNGCKNHLRNEALCFWDIWDIGHLIEISPILLSLKKNSNIDV